MHADISPASSDTHADIASGKTFKKPLNMLARSHHATWLHPWSWEMGACLASLIGYFSIIGLLTVYDGKSRPDWPYGITLNSAVSFLATVTKGFTLVSIAACTSQFMWISYGRKTQNLYEIDIYDAASRGPWGAFVLLCTFKMKNIACLLALLALLAIGVDPTVQQAIDYRTRDVEVIQDARLPRAQSFTQVDDGATGSLIGGPQPPAALTGLVYNGIFFNSSEPGRASLDVVPTCPTGKCSFPRFASLAVCSSCQDLTDAVEKRCYADAKPWNSTTLIRCLFVLPNGLSINLTRWTIDKEQYVFGQYEGQTIATSAHLPLVDATQHGGDRRTHSVANRSRSFTPYRAWGGSFLNITSLNGTSKGGQMTVNASQCSLYWCINTYEAGVINGAFHEKVTSSWRNDSARWIVDYNQTAGLTRTTIDSKMILNPPMISPELNPSPFYVFYQPVEAFWTWLAPKFTFSDSRAVAANGRDEFNGTLDSKSNRSVWEIAPWLDLQRNLRMLGLEKVATNVAKAITLYLRTVSIDEQTRPPMSMKYGIEGAEQVVGKAFVSEVYIHIRWAWMAFLGSIIVLTTISFVLTVVQSRKHNVAVWKSSPLALLFHGVNFEEPLLDDLNTIPQMEKHAKSMSVKLNGTNRGTMLEGQ
ncbi:hypothetical protein E8E11_005129 [Didymella keratinophila]|nr:hypothetical protein E8E11_005129 [Didymella keratinophila]